MNNARRVLSVLVLTLAPVLAFAATPAAKDAAPAPAAATAGVKPGDVAPTSP